MIDEKIKDDKLKPLLPVLREKKRFILIKVEADKKFEFNEIANGLNSSVMYYMGAIDFGKSGFWILKDKFDYENQKIVVKCSVKYKDKCIASISLINKIKGVDVSFKVLNVSGTLKGVNKENN